MTTRCFFAALLLLGLSTTHSFARPSLFSKKPDCRLLFERIKLTRSKISFSSHQIIGVRTDLSALEKDMVRDYLSNSALSEAYFVSMFNEIDSSIPVRNLETVLGIINLQENVQVPVKAILASMRSFKKQFHKSVMHQGKKEIGFSRRIDQELSWDEAIPFYLQFGQLISRDGKVAVEDYVAWSIKNGAHSKESLLHNVGVMNAANLKWRDVQLNASKIMALEFESNEIGFHASKGPIHMSLDGAILALAHLSRKDIKPDDASDYLVKYIEARHIRYPGDLIAALENDF
jgi:hypothetical protein